MEEQKTPMHNMDLGAMIIEDCSAFDALTPE
jgi:hypothetical protein